MTLRMKRLSQDPDSINKELQQTLKTQKSAPETTPGILDEPDAMGDDLGAEPMAEGAPSPDPIIPDLPTLPAEGMPDALGMGPMGEAPVAQEGPSEQEVLEKLDRVSDKADAVMEKLEELVGAGGQSKTITTSVPQGQASLENIAQEPGELTGGGEAAIQTGLELGMSPFSSNARRSSMKVNRRDSAPPATKRVVRAEELEPTDGPPMAVPGTEEMSETVDGEKPFVDEPKQETGNISMDEDPGSVAPLFPTAAQLRDSRRSRIGLAPETADAPPSSVSQDEREALVVAAERKASDLAGLYLTRYQSAIELAHKAQERGIVASPLRDKLATRLAQAGVPDAEILAAEVVEGTATENFRVAHNQALSYLDMDDETFLRVAETIHKTPGGTRTARSDRERLAQDVRSSATQGSLPVQASGPLSPAEGLRERLRRTTPRPVGVPYTR